MTNHLFTAPRTLARLRYGPLAPYHDAYALALHEQGYARQSIRPQVLLIADFSRWLHRNRFGASDVDHPLLERFLCQHRKRRTTGSATPTLNRLLTMLRAMGVAVPQAQPPTRTARQKVTDAFRSYLLDERGLSRSVARHYIPLIDSFLHQRYGDRTPHLSRLRASDVTEFLRGHVHQRSPGYAKNLVTALRSFFRYVYQHRMIARDLSTCVPSVPAWSLSTVPKFLPAGAVERVVRRCDRRTGMGRRDDAILLLLARLGLRAGEVVSLELDDIDWEAGQLTVRGKGGRSAQFP